MRRKASTCDFASVPGSDCDGEKIDEDRQPRAILADDSREAEQRIRLQINKQ
jgi:hypothetical protein